MAYHTNLYLFAFLPAVLLLYQIVPQKMRWKILLAASYAFFWTFSGKLVIYLVGTTVFTYGIARWLGALQLQCTQTLALSKKEEHAELKKRYKKRQKCVLVLGIVILVGVLGYLKYFNFFLGNLNSLLQMAGVNSNLQAMHLLLPIGISFYTLEAIGYMTDVYWKKIAPEHHIGKVALFLGFFPQIMEGPICLYTDTADQLWKCESLKEDNLKQGAIRILWGAFKKMIIADRLYLLVQSVFEHYENYHGMVVVVAAIAYTTQLYMEFSGCMDIVIGSGRMFGVKLPENFKQPFAAKSASEFWRRWHITLGIWFKTYIFYPVSVSGIVKKWNKFGKKHLKKHLTKLGVSALALFPVWLCNGLWHGASWNYIFYGMYYYVILLAEVALEPVSGYVLQKCRLNKDAIYWKLLQTMKTWTIIFVGELFFRANGLKAGIKMFFSMFHEFSFTTLWDGTFLYLGLEKTDFIVVIAGCIVVAVVGMFKERSGKTEINMQNLKLPVRWGICYSLIFAVIIFGAYGEGYIPVELIYAGF